jgi:4-amino-4-deoxy-L-arabinose transferase-like glycosyltransferase
MAPDEAYYWVWSHTLAPGYLDHPPMVALWIRAGTAIAGDGNLGVRMLGPFAAALGSVLLVRAGDDLLPGRHAGLWAAGLMNATLLFAVGATTMTPDTPLLLFWTMTLWALARLQATGRGAWWLVAGAAAGLALDSKYTAVLLAPSILLWLLLVPQMRPWLRRWQPYVAAVLAIALFSPVLWWNAEHGWISFAKQGGRADDWHPARALQFIGELIGGQVGLATPLVAVVCGAGMVLALRQAWRGTAGWTLLACLTSVPSLVFLQHALGDRVQANWPAILYPAAAIAAAGLAGRWRRLLVPAMALGFGLTAIVWVQAIAAPIALPMMMDPTLLRLGGWQSLADSIDEVGLAQGARFIAVDNYGIAALLARLLPKGRVVLGIDPRWALFSLPDADPVIDGRPGILIRSARRDDHPDPADWSEITPLAPLTRARGGMTAEQFRLYRVIGRPGPATVVILPRPEG